MHQHHIEDKIAAECVIPGQPVHHHVIASQERLHLVEIGAVARSRSLLALAAWITVEAKLERSPMTRELECGSRKLYFISLEMKEVANPFGIEEEPASFLLGRLINKNDRFVGGGEKQIFRLKENGIKKIKWTH